MRPIIPRTRRRIIVAGALIALVLSCGAEKKAPPLPLSPDELYLVDAYVRVRRASALYPYQRGVADSLLTRLAGTVDTVRVARTIAGLNANPERWTLVFQSIEKRLSEPPRAVAAESTLR